MAILSEIQSEYKISPILFERLIKTIKYDHSKRSKNFHEFIEELPPKLRLDLAAVMHKKMYASVTFFKEKDSIFLAWIGTVIRPFTVQEQQFIYKEGETIMEIYFILKGQIGFALPRFLNKVYY